MNVLREKSARLVMMLFWLSPNISLTGYSLTIFALLAICQQQVTEEMFFKSWRSTKKTKYSAP